MLGYPKLRPHIDPAQARDFVENIEVLAVLATELPSLTAFPDPDDNLILATAIAGGATAVVSGDKSGMLALGEVEGIPILSVRGAVDRLEELGWFSRARL